MKSSFKRHLNLIGAGYSYLSSSVTGRTFIPGMPVSLSVELTNNCNLHCPHCPSGSGEMTRKRGFMKPGLFRKIMDEAGPYLYNVNLYFQGEPMLHPLFPEFIKNCPDTSVTVSTNGHFITDETADLLVQSKLKKLIVSVDGLDQKTYSAYRVNGDLEKVISGLKRISASKMKYNSSLKLEIQFLVNKINEHQVQGMKELAGSYGALLRLKSMQITDGSDVASWLPSTNRFRRYRLKDGEYEIRSTLPDRCGRLWFNPVITWDGLVVPCCFDKNAEYVMGDLKVRSFRDIWNGEEYRNFRKKILNGRYKIEMCRNCTSGLKIAT